MRPDSALSLCCSTLFQMAAPCGLSMPISFRLDSPSVLRYLFLPIFFSATRRRVAAFVLRLVPMMRHLSHSFRPANSQSRRRTWKSPAGATLLVGGRARRAVMFSIHPVPLPPELYISFDSIVLPPLQAANRANACSSLDPAAHSVLCVRSWNLCLEL